MTSGPGTPTERSRRRVLLATCGVVASVGLGGLAAAGGRHRRGHARRGHARRWGGSSNVRFSDPVRLNPPGKYGYEPSVDVDPHGTIYSTAHKASVTNEGTRLSSWFWYSTDGGDTWHDMPSNAQVDNKQYAFEGDIAVDDEGRVYYVDTYAAENHLNRWLTEPGGPVWDFSKPAQGTTGIDDRPWLQAHGDGIVYYLGNNGIDLPAPETPDRSGRIWFYRSTDGGLSWSLGRTWTDTDYLSLAASKADDSVYIAGPLDDDFEDRDQDDGEEIPFGVVTGRNHGTDFVVDREVAFYEKGPADPFSAWSVTDRAGHAYHVTVDDDPYDKTSGNVLFVRGETGSWDVLDVTPFGGTFTKPWIGAGREGLVAIVFYATKTIDTGRPLGLVQDVLTDNPPSDWFPYALVTTNARSNRPKWTLRRLTTDPVATDGGEPEDFFEVAVGPMDRIHVTFGREIEPGTVRNASRTYRNNLFYVQGRIPGISRGEGVDTV